MQVAPRAGAWIETDLSDAILATGVSRPARARGLKQYGASDFMAYLCRAPRGRVD